MFSGEFARRKARRLRTLLELEREMEQAMGIFEGKRAPSKTDAAIAGLFAGLGSIPGLGVPQAIRDARSKGSEAVVRAAYHHAKYQISLARTQLDGYRSMNAELVASTSQIWVILGTIAKAAGMTATPPHWSD
jgi:beta-phosphoglucomutase-like phosphatase (HAD superfamily)